jgi:hypothetical protein
MPLSFSSKKTYSEETIVVPNANNMAATNDQPFEDVSVMIRSFDF